MLHKRNVKIKDCQALPVFILYQKSRKMEYNGQPISRKEYERKSRETLKAGGSALLVCVME